MLLYFFRSLLDSFQHNADFGYQQHGKHDQEYKEGCLYRAGFQSGNGSIHRKQILNSPRLTSYFGNYPSRLTCNIGQRNTPKSNPMQPIAFDN